MLQRRWGWVIGAALALGVFTTLPSLDVGLVTDDHGHRFFLQRHLALGGPGAFDMFDICGRSGPADISQRIAAGALPWWTLPELSMAFFRPLAVATHYVDYFLWPNAPRWMHAQNLLWYGLLVLAVGALYRRLLGATPVAAIALCLYAIDDAHADGVAWIASRNTLMTALLVVLTLLAYDHVRRGGSRLAALAAPMCLLLALLSGEGAIATWAYLFPYALLLDTGPLRKRLLPLLPLLTVTVTHQLCYRLLGYGVRGSGVYRDPLQAPYVFATERLPDVWPLLIEQFGVSALGRSVLPWLSSPAARILLGSAAIGGAVMVIQLARHRPGTRFFAVSLLASAVPVCAIGVHPRLLFIPGIAAFALVGELVWEAVTTWPRNVPAWKRFSHAAVGVIALLVHGPLAAYLAPLTALKLATDDAFFRRAALMLPHGPQARGDTVFVLDTPSYIVTALTGLYWDRQTGGAAYYILGASGEGVRLTRPTVDTLTLEPRGGYLREPTSLLVRAPEHRFERGQTIPLGRMLITVDEITTDGRPAKVTLKGTRLGSSHHRWLAWRADGYHNVILPHVGHSAWIARFEPPTTH